MSSRALVLSGSLGKGHDSVAEACVAALAPAGFDAQVLDCMKLLGKWGGAIGEALFRQMFSVPPLYDAFHFSQMRAGGRLGRFLERTAAERLVRRLRRQIVQSQARLVVSVFSTGAGALGRLRPEFPDVPTVVVCTDASAHSFWVHPGIHRYLVCSEMAAGTVRQYVPDADIVIVPPPVRPAFFAAPHRTAAREDLGLDPQVPCVLLMAGGWGLAPIEEAADQLVDAGYRVLALAGSNQKLRSRLEASKFRAASRSVQTSDKGGLSVFGFTDKVPVLMAACDVVVTSPGQACHEARVVGRPLVVLDTVPGHGRENLLLELEHGGALSCTLGSGRLLAAVRAILDGFVAPPPPWPVRSQVQWNEIFVGSIADLVGIEAP